MEILVKHAEAKIVTHSVPVAWHLMEFRNKKYLDDSASVELLDGQVDSVTGVIMHGRLPNKIPSDTFIYAPRAFARDGITANHNIKQIKDAWTAKSHKRVILLSTYSRFLDRADESVKTIGYIRSYAKRGSCDLVIPEEIPKKFNADDRRKIDEILTILKECGVKIHHAPRCKKSKWNGD
jgi:hypothetical protein